MAEALISRRGGGGGLNFKVVNGTTAPSNPKENMIWVNTSTKITSYIFSATQPTGSAGMVWISTDTSSEVEFNALKKNGIQVYPLSAKQYVSGAWADKTAKTYQNGKWVEWITDLFLLSKDGTHDDVTGGWYIASGYVLEKQTDGTYLFKRNTATYGECYTKSEIDFTEYKTLIIKTTKSGGGGSISFWVKNNTIMVKNASNGAEEITLDVTTVNEKCKMYMSPSSSGAYIYIESIRLVK